MLTIYMVGLSVNLLYLMMKFYFQKIVHLEDLLNTPDVSDIAHYIESDLNYPDDIKETTKHLTLCPENQVNLKINFVTLWMR